jgi:methylmalonyl-CoA mutase
MTNPFLLSQGFETPDLSAWQDIATRALKGAPLEKLTTKTYDNVPIKPLYTQADMPSGVDGQAASARDHYLPWDIRQTVLNPDPVIANQVALADLERGVSSIEFVIDPSGQCGVAVDGIDGFLALMQDILFDIATVAISTPASGVKAATELAAVLGEDNWATAKIAFNLAPHANMMTGGGTLATIEAMAFAKSIGSRFPCSTSLRADARPVHEGGGSDGQELAVLIASGLEFLRAGEAIGMTPAQVNQTLLFTVCVGPDVVVEIAKLKAARRLWARVLDACGAAGAMKLQAVTSGRMQTVADPWTNILRATCATFAAGAGGADVVTVLPFTSAYEVANEQARRIARNTQLVLQEETHLGRVADPAAGAWAMEAIADDLAKVAWGLVQEIERAGGLTAALASGLVLGWVATTRAARERDVAKRKTALVGVSVFPNLGEDLAAFPPRPEGEVPKGRRRCLPLSPPCAYHPRSKPCAPSRKAPSSSPPSAPSPRSTRARALPRMRLRRVASRHWAGRMFTAAIKPSLRLLPKVALKSPACAAMTTPIKTTPHPWLRPLNTPALRLFGWRARAAIKVWTAAFLRVLISSPNSPMRIRFWRAGHEQVA